MGQKKGIAEEYRQRELIDMKNSSRQIKHNGLGETTQKSTRMTNQTGDSVCLWLGQGEQWGRSTQGPSKARLLRHSCALVTLGCC